MHATSPSVSPKPSTSAPTHVRNPVRCQALNYGILVAAKVPFPHLAKPLPVLSTMPRGATATYRYVPRPSGHQLAGLRPHVRDRLLSMRFCCRSMTMAVPALLGPPRWAARAKRERQRARNLQACTRPPEVRGTSAGAGGRVRLFAAIDYATDQISSSVRRGASDSRISAVTGFTASSGSM